MTGEKKLHRYCEKINALLDEVRREHPNAVLYLDGTQNLNMMSGPPHDFDSVRPHHDRVLYSAKLRADGGDW